jgi:hypothetical protein
MDRTGAGQALSPYTSRLAQPEPELPLQADPILPQGDSQRAYEQDIPRCSPLYLGPRTDKLCDKCQEVDFAALFS